MSDSHELTNALLQAVIVSPGRRLSFRQGDYTVTIELAPAASLQESPVGTAPFSPPPPSRMKLQLLDDNVAPQTPPPTTPPPTTTANRPTPATAKTGSKPGDALRTMGATNALTPVDFLSMLSDKERANAEALFASFGDPPRKPKPAPVAEQGPQEVKKSLSDTQPDPEEEEPGATPPSKFENAFADDDDDDYGWQVLPTSSFRILRNTDTPKVLTYLFRRLGAKVDLLDQMLPLPNSQLSSAHLAKAAGVTSLLPQAIPFAHTPETPPHYHLVGQTRDNAFVLLYQDASDETLHFAPIPPGGGNLQIALVEGETLLTDGELTELFKEGAREATPEQAEATAKLLQKKLSQKADAMGHRGHRPLALSPVSIQQHRGLERAIPVNQRLIKRLEYNRTMDQEHLWDQSVQPGVAVFRYNLATLFQGDQPLIEGVLLCLLERRQYLVFDRRTKRTVPLNTNGTQQIWLRHDERLA